MNKLISNIVKSYSPENIIFWGETPTLNFHQQKGYKLEKNKLELFKREMVFPVDKFVRSGKYKNYLNKAKKEKLKLKFSSSNQYKSDYLKLLAETHDNMVGVKSISYYSIFPHNDRTRFVEVLKDDKLVSVNIVIEALPNYVCFAEVGYDKKFSRISGISRAMLIEFYLLKTKYISWGGSASEGIFNYKKEILGKTPICFYDNYVQYIFYRKKKMDWWLDRIMKK